MSKNTAPHKSCIVTFRVSRRRREMYIGHASLSVCVCLVSTVYCTDPDVTWGMVRDAQ